MHCGFYNNSIKPKEKVRSHLYLAIWNWWVCVEFIYPSLQALEHASVRVCSSTCYILSTQIPIHLAKWEVRMICLVLTKVLTNIELWGCVWVCDRLQIYVYGWMMVVIIETAKLNRPYGSAEKTERFCLPPIMLTHVHNIHTEAFNVCEKGERLHLLITRRTTQPCRGNRLTRPHARSPEVWQGEPGKMDDGSQTLPERPTSAEFRARSSEHGV